MSYISHSQVWALKTDDDKLFVGGRTNRAQVSFERELMGMLDSVSDAQPPEKSASNEPALAK